MTVLKFKIRIILFIIQIIIHLFYYFLTPLIILTNLFYIILKSQISKVKFKN